MQGDVLALDLLSAAGIDTFCRSDGDFIHTAPQLF